MPVIVTSVPDASGWRCDLLVQQLSTNTFLTRARHTISRNLQIYPENITKMVNTQSLGIQVVILIMYLIIARRGQIGPKQHALNFGVWLAMSFGTRILEAIDMRLVNVFGVVFMGVMARLYWLFGDRSRNTTVRSQDETCSLGVFMGSGLSATIIFAE